MIVAVLLIQRAHGLNQVEALQFVVLGHLADEHGGIDGVLVAHVVAGQIAVALLEAKDEAVDLAGIGQTGDDVADVLEAGEAAAQLKAVLLGQRVNHGRGHDGGDGDLAGEILATLGAHLADVVEQQDAHLVAGQQRVVVTIGTGHAHTIGVGVGRE